MERSMEEYVRHAPAVLVAGAASMGAGAIHAAAIGAHAEHPQVVQVFTVLAVLQLGWAVLVLVRPARWVSAVGMVLGAAALGGWTLAKTSGLGFVDGLETAEPAQWADGLGAALAAVAGVACGVHLLLAGAPDAADVIRAPLPRRVASVAVVGILALSLTAMTSAANHRHGPGEAAAGHAHTDGEAGSEHEHASGAGVTDDHAEPSPAVATAPYDPALPIDLGGVDGVTPEQQARAENLVANTLWKLPQFADVSSLEARGYHSIGDAGTGYEHFVNWDLIDDGRQLDPDHPESVVFEVNGGERTLVSAMYFAETDVTLDSVPDIGGSLTQWHIHNNLCYTLTDPPTVAGLTEFDGTCRPGTRDLGVPRPMIHVWIRTHRCGPFSALDGVGAGQVKPGETTSCDHAHGAH